METVSLSTLAKPQTHSGTTPLWSRIVLLGILAYEGLGGWLGGSLLIARPDGRLMDMPVDLMRGTFETFLVPGIILFAMASLSALAFFKVLRRTHDDWIWTCLGLGGWYIWFAVEIIILQELHWLHLMWGAPVLLGIISAIPLILARHRTTVMVRGLLYCGILSSLWYTFMNLFVPFYYPGYSSFSYTVSELSAVGAPTRILWVLLGTMYPLLYAAFGWGVLNVPGSRRHLKMLGILILAYSIFNLYWPPMHMREVIAAGGKSLSDTLHIAWTMVTVLLFIATMGFGAAALGKTFRIYTIVSILLLMTCGILTSLDTANLEANLPTPWMGMWERINQYIYFLWVVVLSLQIIKRTTA